MFENLLGNFKQKFADSQERKRIEKEELAKMQREVDFQAQQTFQEEFKKNALRVAISKAKKDAASKSGIQKLVALNRAKRLQEPGSRDPSNFFNKFSAYTQKNMARTEENKKRTAEMREAGKKMQKEKPSLQTPKIRPNLQTPGIRKPFQPSGFGRR